MTPDEYCQNKAAASGSSFYYSFLFLPEPKRRAITALYAFCREVDDIVDQVGEPAVARAKLGWWRDEIARLFAGEPRHPVAQALGPVIQRHDLAREYFEEIIDGMEMDLDHRGFEDYDDLALYCYRVAGVVGLLAAEIFGYRDRATRRYACELGSALQLTNILRDVREDALRGRTYIPRAELRRFGVTHDELRGDATGEAARALFGHLAERARGHYQRAFEVLPDGDRPGQLSGIIMGEIYRALLDKIVAGDCRVLERRVGMTPIRKLWIAWRVARKEKRLHRQLGLA